MKGAGVLAGVFDLTLALPQGRSAYWETKNPWTSLSIEQKAFADAMRRLGHELSIVRSVDDARAELHRLGIETREAKLPESAKPMERAG
jgi:hypothetical protein